MSRTIKVIATHRHSVIRVLSRYVSGRPLSGERITDATFIRTGTQKIDQYARPGRWAYMAGYKRAAVRIGAPAAIGATTYAYVVARTDLTYGAAAAGGAGLTYGSVRARRWVRTRRFDGTYTRPLARAIAPTLNLPDTYGYGSWLTISDDFADLTPRLASPMSPFETRVRTAYAAHVAPALQWTPDRIRRAMWWASEQASPVTTKLAYFRRPRAEAKPSRVEVRAPGYVTDEQKRAIKAAIAAKLGIGDLLESWDQVGTSAVGTWTIRVRPPNTCTYADLLANFGALPEPEFFVGLGAGGRAVTISLDDDAPHIACSAGSGAGKSVLAMLLAVQVIRRGGHVLILDRKGSHRWARGIAGVTYCTRPADMHAALLGFDSLADARNTEAMEHDEGWDPGPRHFMIFEEMNATVAQLKAYWDSIRQPGQPKTSPAIQAFRNSMYMGRSAKHNLFGVAQMMTANTTGGPEARENFGVRALARYTANNWKMLAPEAPMPRKSKTRGRWQIVIAGEAIETQVCYLLASEARTFAEGGVPVSLDPLGVGSTGIGDRDTAPGGDIPADPGAELVTLAEAVDRGLVGGPFATAKKRLQRATDGPLVAGKSGRANTYKVSDLIEWDEKRGANTAAATQ